MPAVIAWLYLAVARTQKAVIIYGMNIDVIAVSQDDCITKSETPDKTATLTKQFSGSGIEINKFLLRAGEAYNLTPPRTAGGIKIFTLLSGDFYCIETKISYQAGSTFVLRPHHDILNIQVGQTGELILHTIGEESFDKSNESFQKLHETMTAIQAKDEYTYNHCVNVHRLVKRMIGPLGYSGQRVRHLLWAARYHDIGKINVEDRILNKPAGLDPAEFEIMKTHVTAGQKLILEYFNESTFHIISQHHERMDGSGYPLGLKGDQIMEEARLLAICDSYDAMISDRVYKKAKSRQEAFAELQELAGRIFDSRLVELFIRIIGKET